SLGLYCNEWFERGVAHSAERQTPLSEVLPRLGEDLRIVQTIAAGFLCQKQIIVGDVNQLPRHALVQLAAKPSLAVALIIHNASGDIMQRIRPPDCGCSRTPASLTHEVPSA